MGQGSLDIVLIYYHLNDDELLSAADRLKFDAVTQGGNSN